MQVNHSKRPTLTLRTRVDAGDRDSEEAIERGIAVRRGVPNDGRFGRGRFVRQYWRGVRSLEEQFRRRSPDQWHEPEGNFGADRHELFIGHHRG